jgi:hypothetical protein
LEAAGNRTRKISPFFNAWNKIVGQYDPCDKKKKKRLISGARDFTSHGYREPGPVKSRKKICELIRVSSLAINKLHEAGDVFRQRVFKSFLDLLSKQKILEFMCKVNRA